MDPILVSACLLGKNCKYNGGSNLCPRLVEYLQDKAYIPVCPEVAAGMPTPRTPIEICGGEILDKNGVSWDSALRQAVEDILEQLQDRKIDCAILQSRSPTCGVNQIYDGSFSGRLIPGSGVLAQALIEAGYRVMDVEDFRG